jgi:hypothetical protein
MVFLQRTPLSQQMQERGSVITHARVWGAPASAVSVSHPGPHNLCDGPSDGRRPGESL